MAAAISNLYGEVISNGFSTTYTVSGLTIGTGTFVVFFWDDVGRTTTGVTIDSVSMTNVVTTSGNKSSLWYADVATASGNLVFTATSGYGLVGVCCGLLTGAATSAPANFTSVNSGFLPDPQSIGPLTIATDGIGFVAIGDETLTGNPTTWNPGSVTRDAVTEASNATGNTSSVAAAHILGTGAAVTPTATGSSGNGWGFSGASMIYAVWDAAAAAGGTPGMGSMQTPIFIRNWMVGS